MIQKVQKSLLGLSGKDLKIYKKNFKLNNCKHIRHIPMSTLMEI